MIRLRTPTSRYPEQLRQLADEELMQRVAANDAEAFEVVLERHADAALSLAYRMIGVRAGAEDVVQEAFLALWRNGARYDRARGSVRNWTLQIVHHRAVDALRRDGPREARQISDDSLQERLRAPEQTDLQVARRDQAREVHDALSKLPREQSRVIELAYFGGFTHTEIAAILDLPAGTVKGRMRLGLQKMRYHLPSREALP
jgi:RNA polymerase sigma-70 factor (ECF subfamily)